VYHLLRSDHNGRFSILRLYIVVVFARSLARFATKCTAVHSDIYYIYIFVCHLSLLWRTTFLCRGCLNLLKKLIWTKAFYKFELCIYLPAYPRTPGRRQKIYKIENIIKYTYNFNKKTKFL